MLPGDSKKTGKAGLISIDSVAWTNLTHSLILDT